eukprot:262263_1
MSKTRRSILKNFGEYGEGMIMWLAKYIPKCKVSTHSYECWKRYFNSKYKKNSLRSIVSNHPLNIAYQCMYGFELFHKGKYSQSLKYLNRVNSTWEHPIILCAVANLLLKLNKHKQSLFILQSLIIPEKWSVCLMYLEACCVTPFLDDLLSILHKITDDCWNKILGSKITVKRMNKYITYKKYCLQLQENIHSENVTRIIKLLAHIIRSNYWNNSHFNAIKYVLKLQKLLKQPSETFLPVHDLQLCCLLLLNTSKFKLCQQFIDDQLINNIHSEYTKMYMFCKAIKSMLFINKNSSQYMEYLREMTHFCQCQATKIVSHDIRAIVGRMYAQIGDINSAKNLFASSAIEYIPMDKNSPINCKDPLCLGEWLFWFMYARFMHQVVKDYKRAKYLYILAIKHNKYDASSYFWYSVLMKNCGKSGLALKYYIKAQQLNNKINYLFTDIKF